MILLSNDIDFFARFNFSIFYCYLIICNMSVNKLRTESVKHLMVYVLCTLMKYLDLNKYNCKLNYLSGKSKEQNRLYMLHLLKISSNILVLIDL